MVFIIGVGGVSQAQEVTVMVKGSSWDSDSRGFASIGGLSVEQGTKLAARRGSRISVDGHPEISAISGKGGVFELTFTTAQPTFRLIVEGDRFPRTITQRFDIPEGGGEVDVGRVTSPRAEGGEHTWPLPMVASALGYASTHEELFDLGSTAQELMVRLLLPVVRKSPFQIAVPMRQLLSQRAHHPS